MLGGIIAGALGGGATAVNGLADQAIQEAQQAKKNAYEKGILEWKVGVDAEAATVAAERQQGNTVLQSQLAGEREKDNNIFTAEENEKNRKAQIKAASISASRGDRITASEQSQAELLAMKKQRFGMPPGPERNDLDERIAAFEGRAAAKPDYMTVKNELGAETVYTKTPSGLVPVPIVGGGGNSAMPQQEQGPWNNFKGQSTAPSQPTETAPPAKKLGLISGNSGGTSLSSDPQNVKRLFNEGIKNAMRDVQQQIVAAPTDQEKIQLAAKYSELQSKLKK